MPRSAPLYTGFALITCSMLLLQQFLTRVFSVQLNAGLAFLAISTTFLGLGAAGVAVYTLPRLFAPQRVAGLVPWLALLYAALLVGGFALEVAIDDRLFVWNATVDIEGLGAQCVRVLCGTLVLLPALFTVGLVISLLLRQHSDRVGRMYGADLIGGAVGCVLVLPLMEVCGGDHAVFAIGALAAGGACLLGIAHGRGVAAFAAGALVGGFVAVPLLVSAPPVQVKSHPTTMPGVRSFVREDKELACTWNALSRLGFFETFDDGAIYVRIDSGCQTGLPSQAPNFRGDQLPIYNFERLAFTLQPPKCLEIGAGGGRGMLIARQLGATAVTGVEINPDIVAASLGRFPGYGVGDVMAKDPAFQLLAGEGRSYALPGDERFDSIAVTFIQTGVASGSAAFALSEANLFTVEAFAGFLQRLTPRGVFHVFRNGPVECSRLVSLLRGAFAKLGVDDVSDRLFLARTDAGVGVVMAAREALPAAQVAQLRAAAARLEMVVLYAPDAEQAKLPPNPLPGRIQALRSEGRLSMREVTAAWKQVAHDPAFASIEADYIRARDPDGFSRDLVVDISAPTDDRPYYFFTGLRRLADVGLYFDPGGTSLLGGTVIMLFWMVIAFAVLVALLLLLPLWLRRPGRGGSRAGLAVVLYFAGIGAAYVAVQISFIQRFSLFLGHPVYSISVVLLAFLLSSGLGAMASGSLFRRGLTVPRLALLLLLLLLAYNQFLPELFRSSALTWPVVARIALSIVLVAGLGFPMGAFFPRGIGLVQAAEPALVPWAWAANSAASVLGAILALVLAIHAGFAVVAMFAGACYLLTTIPAAAMLQRVAATSR